MLKNYLILTWKVLSRKRFFTFISLFGISFTLMVLVTITAFLDSELGTHPPLSQKDRITFLTRLEMDRIVPDTTYIVDSTKVNGMMRYDSTMQIGENRASMSRSSFAYIFLDRYLRDLPSAELMSIYNSRPSFDLFLNGKKLVFNVLYSDANFWRIFDLQFIEGEPFTASAVQNRIPDIVITRAARLAYFGSEESALGKEIELNREKFRVVGVVEPLSKSKRYAAADAYLPLPFLRDFSVQNDDYFGGFESVFLSASEGDRALLKEEILHKATTIPIPNPEEYNTIVLEPLSLEEGYASGIFREDKNSLLYLYLVFGGLMGLFVLLPTLNLINVNITRILERSSEIGVRKAFGARTGDLLLQFVFENVVLTLIGGLIGFLLAVWLIHTINETQVFGDITLDFSTSAFLYGVGITLFFGILSGLLPAWRMSSLHVIQALKQNPS